MIYWDNLICNSHLNTLIVILTEYFQRNQILTLNLLCLFIVGNLTFNIPLIFSLISILTIFDTMHSQNTLFILFHMIIVTFIFFLFIFLFFLHFIIHCVSRSLKCKDKWNLIKIKYLNFASLLTLILQWDKGKIYIEFISPMER